MDRSLWWTGHCDGQVIVVDRSLWWTGHCDGQVIVVDRSLQGFMQDQIIASHMFWWTR